MTAPRDRAGHSLTEFARTVKNENIPRFACNITPSRSQDKKKILYETHTKPAN
jgi:hypothetical protein